MSSNEDEVIASVEELELELDEELELDVMT